MRLALLYVHENGLTINTINKVDAIYHYSANQTTMLFKFVLQNQTC